MFKTVSLEITRTRTDNSTDNVAHLLIMRRERFQHPHPATLIYLVYMYLKEHLQVMDL